MPPLKKKWRQPVEIFAPSVSVSEEYETANQVASRLHVKPGTIYDWSSRDENPLPAKRITNKVL